MMSREHIALQRLRATVGGAGWRAAVVATARLEAVCDAIVTAHASGLFDEAFYEVELEPRFEWEPPRELSDANSVVVVARPVPSYSAVFVWRGVERSVVIPPTYLGYAANSDAMLGSVQEAIGSEGFQVIPARLPQKALAVRGGIARWGRNNIAYVDGMGSFAQIVTGWTDLPADVDTWREPLSLDRCSTCRACAAACPTGAIGEDRFLLHGERCLTHLNEWEGEFPVWLDPLAHNALVGCMDCQTSCPENREALERTEESGIVFDEEETALLIADAPLGELPAGTASKVGALDILIEYPLVCRNLRALLGTNH